MKKLGCNLIKSTKGAVTVFVSLLLIPAILVSGTAVDLTRMYTARSIISDANQLAANSVLSQYNALLNDLYGLFGIAQNDPVLAQLLDDYISITVFGEDGRDRSRGTLQLFYGSNLSLEEVYFPESMNLRNPDVLRRQIEEYMKFRAPVIIVSEVMEMLGSSKFKEDTEVIADKLEIEEALAEMHDKYKEFYDAVCVTDVCDKPPGDNLASVVGVAANQFTNYIRTEIVNLKNCLDDWEDEEDPDKKADLANKFRAILKNIEYRTVGGRPGSNWRNGGWSTISPGVQGANNVIANQIERANDYKSVFNNIVRLARDLDNMNAELSAKIDELENKLENGECSEELKIALYADVDPETGKTLIETYRDILKWDDIESMSEIYKDGGYEYIDGPITDWLNGMKYRHKDNPSSANLSREQLANATTTTQLGLIAGNRALSTLAGYSSAVLAFGMPDGFVKFGEHPGDNEVFFAELEAMMNGSDLPPISLYDEQEEGSGSSSDKKQKNMINQLLDLVDEAYTGLTNNPLGAEYISEGTTDPSRERNFSITGFADEMSSHSVLDVISDPLGCIARAGDYLLLLTYCSSMFSDYTTARPQSNGKTMDEIDEINFPKSISGIPISPKVNYFFQSELEYLYNGDNNANKNLNAISRLIYLVRMICNYITVFKVTEVTRIVNSIKKTFAANPILAVVLGELARAAFVAAESAVDLASLRAGHKVLLIKGKEDWICSPSGLKNALNDVLENAAEDDDREDDDEKGLAYSNYLLFFFIAKGVFGPGASIELAVRTADLIEWNMINCKGGFLCDEEAMTDALGESGRFRLEEMHTDFSITTTADMRMLFLSMIVAQNFSEQRGLSMPQTFPVTVTDYRGY